MSWRPWPSFACWERCIWSLGNGVGVDRLVAPRPDVILWHEYIQVCRKVGKNEASANKNANRNMLETRCEPLKYALSISWIFLIACHFFWQGVVISTPFSNPFDRFTSSFSEVMYSCGPAWCEGFNAWGASWFSMYFILSGCLDTVDSRKPFHPKSPAESSRTDSFWCKRF